MLHVFFLQIESNFRYGNQRRQLIRDEGSKVTPFQVPMHFYKLHNTDWSVMEERFKYKLSTWEAKHLSY